MEQLLDKREELTGECIIRAEGISKEEFAELFDLVKSKGRITSYRFVPIYK